MARADLANFSTYPGHRSIANAVAKLGIGRFDLERFTLADPARIKRTSLTAAPMRAYAA